jgi:cell wall-associated NlpC family hydrolase
VYYVFRQFDYSVTRTASSQYSHDGTKISKSELQPGDLVFFSSNGGYNVTHVGIYIGNNEFVHASTPKIGVVVSSLDSTYYTNVWYGAKRVLP